MAYNAVSQADLEVVSNATDSDGSRSPSPHRKSSHQHLPLDTDNIGGGSYLQPAKGAEESTVPSLGSMIRSMTATSYDMVEDDDYETADPSAKRSSNGSCRVPPLNTAAAARADSPEPPLRTPISDQPVPLSHPTPDLQSLQGAYLNNVERLERSAERLSSSSADIGSEIRRMNHEQKRRSGSTASNTTASNLDGRPMSSRQGSIQSASRLAQVSEHGPAERYYQSMNRAPVEPILPPPPPPPAHSHQPAQGDLDINFNDQYSHIPLDVPPRPSTAASTDTYQQARVLFNDFDGVHYIPYDKSQDLARRVSLTRPPLAKNSESYKEPKSGENMVYYPAPVPMMLNLPPKLSQRPSGEREKRRTQLLTSVQENRKSAAWPNGDDGSDSKRDRQLADLPPQLRASVFFESPGASLDIDVKKDSAVATLDSILDASAHAPVTAFTDHPYAGRLGPEVYGHTGNKLSKDLSAQKKKHDSKSTLRPDHQISDTDTRANSLASRQPYNKTEAEAADLHESTSLREDGREGHGETEHPEGSGEEGDLQFTGPPTTLLAELEMRKRELRQRTRVADNSVAMHSTLLQLEAVAQKQNEHRRQRPVTLAWESSDVQKADSEDDDDVPLGMLYPEQATALDDNRPLGLMEKRQIEESEPLSKRRARLRGEAPPPPRTPDRRPVTMYSQNLQEPPAEPESEDEANEGETLAQRLKRLKGKDRTSTVAESEFATEILAELSHLNGDDEKDKDQPVAPEDETLAQRRSRLQKEVEAQNSTMKIPRYRRSMADILHARRPATVGRQSFQEPQAPPPRGLIHQHSYDNRMSMNQFPPHIGSQAGGLAPYQQGQARPESFGYGMAHPNTFYSDAILGMNHLSYAMPNQQHPKVVRPGTQPGQHEMIDRWRQSIM